jgi:hypothetical protein
MDRNCAECGTVLFDDEPIVCLVCEIVAATQAEKIEKANCCGVELDAIDSVCDCHGVQVDLDTDRRDDF